MYTQQTYSEVGQRERKNKDQTITNTVKPTPTEKKTGAPTCGIFEKTCKLQKMREKERKSEYRSY